MAAAYPAATKSFSTKTDGPSSTIFASHVNDLQDEVVAVENGLRTGIAHNLIPSATNTDDLGSASKEWKDGYFAGVLYERARSVPIGVWVNVAYDGTNFSAGGGGTWDLAIGGGDQIAFKYMLVGKTLFVDLIMGPFGITGTVTTLIVVIPLGVTATTQVDQPMIIYNNSASVWEVGKVLINGTTMTISRLATAAFTVGADNSYLKLSARFEIN